MTIQLSTPFWQRQWTFSITVSAGRLLRWGLVAIVAVFALALRFYAIGTESLWGDEVGHYRAATAQTLRDMFLAVRVHHGTAPLDYMLLRAYLALTGAEGEAGLRSLYAILGTLSVLLLYKLGREVYGWIPGLISAAALAVCSFHIHYSQEVRFYALAVFMAILCMWLFVRAMQRPSWRAWLLWSLAALAGLYTAYFIAFVLLAQGLYVLGISLSEPARYRTHFLPFANVSALVIGLFAPWLWWDSQLDNLSGGRGLSPALYSAFLSTSTEVIGEPILLWAMMAACVIGAIFVREGLLWLGTVLTVFYGALYIDNLSGYFFHPRQLLVALPFLLLGVFAAPVAVGRWLGLGRLGVIVSAILCAVYVGAAIPRLHEQYTQRENQNFQAMVEFLRPDLQDIDTVYVLAPTDYRAAVYYLEQLDTLASIRLVAEDVTKAISIPGAGKIWVVARGDMDLKIPETVPPVVIDSHYVVDNVNIYRLQREVPPEIAVETGANLPAQPPAPKTPIKIDPATLPKSVVLDGDSLVISNAAWTVRGDNQITAQITTTATSTIFSFAAQPDRRARAGWAWSGPVDVSHHHIGVLRAYVPHGCKILLETVTPEGRERVITGAGWQSGQWFAMRFPIRSDTLARLDILIDGVDSNTSCFAEVSPISLLLDEQFTIQ